jgi:hypothetical protein
MLFLFQKKKENFVFFFNFVLFSVENTNAIPIVLNEIYLYGLTVTDVFEIYTNVIFVLKKKKSPYNTHSPLLPLVILM